MPGTDSGWFIDATPGDDVEFVEQTATAFRAIASSAALEEAVRAVGPALVTTLLDNRGALAATPGGVGGAAVLCPVR